MAYISAQEDDDQVQQAQAPQAAAGGGGAAPPLAGGATGAPQAAASAQPTSKFVNFSRFLNANRDAAAGAAGNIAGGVQKEGDVILGQAQQAASKLEADAKATLKPYVHGQNMGSAGYSGPASVSGTSGWGDIQQRSQDMQTTANHLQTPGGLGAVLDPTGQRSVGARSLDTSLISNAGANQLASVRDRYSNMSSKLRDLDASSKRTVDDVNRQNAESQKAYADANAKAEAAWTTPEQNAEEKRLEAVLGGVPRSGGWGGVLRPGQGWTGGGL